MRGDKRNDTCLDCCVSSPLVVELSGSGGGSSRCFLRMLCETPTTTREQLTNDRTTAALQSHLFMSDALAIARLPSSEDGAAGPSPDVPLFALYTLKRRFSRTGVDAWLNVADASSGSSASAERLRRMFSEMFSTPLRPRALLSAMLSLSSTHTGL